MTYERRAFSEESFWTKANNRQEKLAYRSGSSDLKQSSAAADGDSTAELSVPTRKQSKIMTTLPTQKGGKTITRTKVQQR